MCIPNTIEYGREFTQNGFKYRIIVENDWNPVHIENITTGKKREIKYFQIGYSINMNEEIDVDSHYPVPKPIVSKINS